MTITQIPKPPRKVLQHKVISNPYYRMGRLGCFIHKEGNEDPISLNEIKTTGNPNLNKQIINEQVDGLWFEKNEQKELIMKVAIICLVIAIVVIVAVAFIRGNQPNV